MTVEHKQMQQPAVKKVYSKPQLDIYGKIAEITRTVGRSGGVDNHNPNHVAVKTR